ncbi:endonuclease/exonuclease/phosphatase family protein [Mangrovimonas aestuarii]|uniref:endonuclease/exonuclease/phosphatase family protein n=1 Tax=Mangrovimonas aestuarii TaxID=3018443 RepID=UPI002379266B|nr:endonuclease/exonuclease/phosphatase family protein [Mangrovimonas aestuarii]
MNSQKLWLLLLSFLISFYSKGQDKKKYQIHTIAFYNLENLFDTINDPAKYDEASPIMELKIDKQQVYKKKIKNMARVISDIGHDLSKNAPVIIGIAEIENQNVLEDLVNDSALLAFDYGIVHYDSPDLRGIDVALLYQKKWFTPINTSKHELKIYDDEKKRVYTRDQLLVSGKLNGELIHITVNHWPSRRGGEARSKPKRMAAAKLCKSIVDSLQTIDPYAKIFIMGDLNDNPVNASLKKVLKTQHNSDDVSIKGIYNPMENLYKKGIGSNAFRDSWSLFDQILISQPLLEKDYSSFRFYKADIFNENYLTTKNGQYKGYPKRSFANGNFTNGYSDHFPAYVYIIRELPQ